MENVKQLSPAHVEEVERTRSPDMGLHLNGDGRKIAVAKLREFADKLESGELDGCRLQWRVRHLGEKAEGKETTEMQTVTVTPPNFDTGDPGAVQFRTYTITEEA